MNELFGLSTAVTQPFGRVEAPTAPREPGADPSATVAFAALLTAALTPRPTARPLTQPAAVGVEGEPAGEAAPAEGEASADGATATAANAGTTGAAGATGAARGAVSTGQPSATSADAALRATYALARQEPARAGAQPAGEAIPVAEPTIAPESGAGEPDAAKAAEAEIATVAGTEQAAAGAEPIGVREATDVVHRGMEGLVPEMRERLERVLHRMKTEYGHDARVSETYRSQSRQDALHAQGRSQPGQVVTWTRNSNHTQGRAADVVVNGGYDDAEGYATLQRVAREEGLHTLGSRDPGHLELPKGVGSTLSAGRRVDLANAANLAELSRIAPDANVTVTDVRVTAAPVAREAAPAPIANPGGFARVAQVARVAHVANVAQVAAVARVATPGAAPSRVATRTASVAAAAESAMARGEATAATATGTATATTGAGATGAAATAAMAAANGARTGGDRRGTGGDAPTPRRDDASAEVGVAGAEAAAGERYEGVAPGGTDHARGTAGVTRAEAVQATAGADALTRLDAIDALREGSAARPLSHLTLTVDDGAGGSDRIRVEARGNAVGVTLDLSSAVSAERVGARMGELQQALEQRGLEADTLRVRSGTAATPDAIDVSRVAAGTLERESARSGSHAGTQQQAQQHDRQDRQDPNAPRDRDGRPAPDDARRESSNRQRPRQEPKETDQ